MIDFSSSGCRITTFLMLLAIDVLKNLSLGQGDETLFTIACCGFSSSNVMLLLPFIIVEDFFAMFSFEGML